MKQTNESARHAEAQAPAPRCGMGGAFPLRAVVKERRPADSLLRDVAEAMAAAAIFS